MTKKEMNIILSGIINPSPIKGGVIDGDDRFRLSLLDRSLESLSTFVVEPLATSGYSVRVFGHGWLTGSSAEKVLAERIVEQRIGSKNIGLEEIDDNHVYPACYDTLKIRNKKNLYGHFNRWLSTKKALDLFITQNANVTGSFFLVRWDNIYRKSISFDISKRVSLPKWYKIFFRDRNNLCRIDYELYEYLKNVLDPRKLLFLWDGLRDNESFQSDLPSVRMKVIDTAFRIDSEYIDSIHSTYEKLSNGDFGSCVIDTLGEISNHFILFHSLRNKGLDSEIDWFCNFPMDLSISRWDALSEVRSIKL